MTRWTVVLIAVLESVGLCAAARPQIGNVTEGVEAGQTALVFGEGFVPMLRATSRFGIEDLTLRRDVGDGMVLLCTNGQEPSRDISLRRVRVKASAMWLPEGIYRAFSSDGIVFMGHYQNVTVDGCWIEGMGGIRINGSMRQARIVNNTLVGHPPYRSRGLLGGRGWSEVVVMNNTVRRAQRGIMANGMDGRGFVHNLVARNVVEEDALGRNAGETYCVEMGHCFYYGPVAEATDTQVRLSEAALDPGEPSRSPANSSGICLVLAGRGKKSSARSCTCKRQRQFPEEAARYAVDRSAISKRIQRHLGKCGIRPYKQGTGRKAYDKAVAKARRPGRRGRTFPSPSWSGPSSRLASTACGTRSGPCVRPTTCPTSRSWNSSATAARR